MRGRARLFASGILFVTSVAAALLIGIASNAVLTQLWIALDFTLPRSTIEIVGGVGLLLDRLQIRPLAVHRQVPMVFGHRRGALAAAARYGPRLGVGPATILTTWLWWSGFIGSALLGRRAAMFAGAVFAGTRVALFLAAATGASDGQAMAARVARAARFEPIVRGGCALTAAVALGLLMGL